jgi:hypothetical protein
MKNPHLEMLSDMVRRGEPVSMQEALDVIEYQTELKKKRKERGWFSLIFSGTPIGQLINLFKQ